MTQRLSFYNPALVGIARQARIAEAMAEGERYSSPRRKNQHQIAMILVDEQGDFIFEVQEGFPVTPTNPYGGGALSIPGATDDTRRLIEFIFRHAEFIDCLKFSLDSHSPFMIFFPSWWVNKKGESPAFFTDITEKDIVDKVWMPRFEPLEWSLNYPAQLAAQSDNSREYSKQKVLKIWPYHTMIGTAGHMIEPSLAEVAAFVAAKQKIAPDFVFKGMIPQTEFYSILEPEIHVPGITGGGLNVKFLKVLETYERIYISGQAMSHCVLATIWSIIRYFAKYNPAVIDRIYILIDAMSPVPGFEASTELAYAQLKQDYPGIHLVRTTDPI